MYDKINMYVPSRLYINLIIYICTNLSCKAKTNQVNIFSIQLTYFIIIEDHSKILTTKLEQKYDYMSTEYYQSEIINLVKIDSMKKRPISQDRSANDLMTIDELIDDLMQKSAQGRGLLDRRDSLSLIGTRSKDAAGDAPPS